MQPEEDRPPRLHSRFMIQPIRCTTVSSLPLDPELDGEW
jgi:hypothetical protein